MNTKQSDWDMIREPRTTAQRYGYMVRNLEWHKQSSTGSSKCESGPWLSSHSLATLPIPLINPARPIASSKLWRQLALFCLGENLVYPESSGFGRIMQTRSKSLMWESKHVIDSELVDYLSSNQAAKRTHSRCVRSLGLILQDRKNKSLLAPFTFEYKFIAVIRHVHVCQKQIEQNSSLILWTWITNHDQMRDRFLDYVQVLSIVKI